MVKTETQHSITEWADATFGKVDKPEALVSRARKELDELEEAVISGNSEEISKEAADVLILLYRLLHIHELDASQAVTEKMQENRARQWQSKGDGTGSHIK
ncbi:dATP/dGTP pyrophosphohydrolase domain-containing protein [Kordiimonas aquimaris]|uniref:dATP/dGTP pyrophosphohydrolase domain-containing protein n=1 Tax=Kordiimonas aquimaris TaxID=707591 RepID=UPI0021D1891E|nr:dATP/dGTP pyrophosphohydrolase domain-containing protein [Kordiimonas aquimaris]